MKFKIFYFISKIHGLSPFNFDWKTRTASASTSSTFYCIVHGTFFSMLAVSSEYFVFQTDTYEHLKSVSLIVGHIEIISTVMKFVSIILLQTIYRLRIIKIIKEVLVLNRKICELCPADQQFYNETFNRLIEKKFYLSLIQLLAFIYAFSGYMVHDNFEIADYLCFFIGLYVQIIPMILTSYYYCGLILHCLQYLRIINKKLSNIIHSNKVERLSSCSASDDMEKISIIYENICRLNKMLNHIFGFQMILFLLRTFCLTLSAIFYIYYEVQESTYDVIKNITITIGFVVFYCIELCYISIISSQAVHESQRFVSLLHLHLRSSPDKRLYDAEILSIQVLHQNVNFSCCSFIQFEISLIFSIVTTIASYFIVLVQFEINSIT